MSLETLILERFPLYHGLVSAPPSHLASLREQVLTGTAPGEGLFSILGVEEGWVCPSEGHYQIYSHFLHPVFYTLYWWHLPSTCLSLVLVLKVFRTWVGKGHWSSVWPSRTLLCFAFSLKMAAELLCKSRLPSVPWLRPQGEHQPPSWPLCGRLPGRKPGISAKTCPQTLMSMFLLSLLPPTAGCLRRQESSLWTLGNPAAEVTDSFSPGSQLGGFSPWKSFSAELHPIPHPGLHSWTVDNTAWPSPLFSAWILLTVNLLKAQGIFWGYFTWKQ